VDWGRRATALGLRIRYVPQIAVETPARSSFGELTRKWDRHIGHDFAEISGVSGRLRWGARALMLGTSPLGEILRIHRSDRVSGVRDRILALFCLTRIRLYRCHRMLSLLSGSEAQTAATWRQGN
jgi:hypothetical protein